MQPQKTQQRLDARKIQRQDGLWVPVVISLRKAAVTEWVFSPLHGEMALWVFLIFTLFRWCVGKDCSLLCQAKGLKSKVGIGCVWIQWDRLKEKQVENTMWEQHQSFSVIPLKWYFLQSVWKILYIRHNFKYFHGLQACWTPFSKNIRYSNLQPSHMLLLSVLVPCVPFSGYA